jgi:hypothetical protein
LKSSATCSGVNRSSHDLKPDSGHETTLGKACVSSTTEEILKVLYIHDNPWEEGMRIKYDGGNSENRVHSVQCEPEAGDEFRLAILSECSLELTEWYSSREIIGLDCDSVEPKCKRESQSRSVY